MAKTVYILTQKGRGYTDEGLEILRDQIYEIYHDDSDLLFMAGQFLNNPDKLIRRLSGNKDGYLALSMEDGVYYFPAKNFPHLIDAIDANRDKNPWELLNRCVLEGLKKNAEGENR